jgi:hypothetical protein
MSTIPFKNNYVKLCEDHGKEKVREVIVSKLRDTANKIEKGGWPDIFACDIENMDPNICVEYFIERVVIIMSHPWLG